MATRRNLTPLLVSLVLPALALAQGGRNGSEPAPPKVEAPKAMEGSAAPGVGQAVDSRTFIIGVEDVIHIDVWREENFTRRHMVRPDGKITLPLAGEVQAAGMTPEKLAAACAEKLGEYINKPVVTVTVEQVNSQKYYIIGQVNRVGQFPLIVPTKIADALQAAGGFRDFADLKHITIFRGQKRLLFNWNDHIKGKHPEQNVFLENGDQINVK